MLSNQDSSLPHTFDPESWPYVEWVQLAQTPEDILKLINALSGTPRPWLEWVEERTQRREEEKGPLDRPLGYRLATLLNGIVLLQETKYVCDVVETGLRQGLVHFCRSHSIRLSDLAIPQWNQVIVRMPNIDIFSFPTERTASEFSFYQLTETFAKNWNRVRSSGTNSPGFSYLFNHSKAHQKVNQFRSNMKQIRYARNDAAHAKKLFAPDDVRKLCSIACLWLEPLGIDLNVRVLSYRSKRPKFLNEAIVD